MKTTPKVRIPSGLMSHLTPPSPYPNPLPPPPPAPSVFSTPPLCHYARFPCTMQALFIRIPAPGCHYTLSFFATMGAFLSPPHPPLFPAESPQASFFVDTFNKTSQLLLRLIIKSQGQRHVLRYKGQSNAKISFTCRTSRIPAQMMK